MIYGVGLFLIRFVWITEVKMLRGS